MAAWIITEIHSGEAISAEGDDDPVLFDTYDEAVEWAGTVARVDPREFVIEQVRAR